MAEETETSGAPATDTKSEPPKTEPPKKADEALGDAGKRALDEERSARKAAEKTAREAQAELDKIKAESMSEQEKAVATARAEGKAEADTAATAKLARAEIKIAAAGKLADPADAVRLLDVDELVDKDGEVDSKKVAKAIDQLLKDKPYLAAGSNSRRGDFDGGARQTAPNGTDMNDLIRERMRH